MELTSTINRILLNSGFYRKKLKTLTFLEMTEKQCENKPESSLFTWPRSLQCLSAAY